MTCDGEPVVDLVPTLALEQIGAGGDGSVNEVESSSAAESGTEMRWSGSGEQYIYNLSTKRSAFNEGQALTAGRYELTISDPPFDDVVVKFDITG